MDKTEILAALEKGYALNTVAVALRKIVDFYGEEMGRYAVYREEARVKGDGLTVEQYSKAMARYETDIGNFMQLAALFENAKGCVLLGLDEGSEDND